MKKMLKISLSIALLMAGSLINAYDALATQKLKEIADNDFSEASAPDIEKLINEGADPNKEYLIGSRTVLERAVLRNRAGIVKVLLNAGADTENKLSNKNTVLIVAAWDSNINPEIVRLLLDAGAEPNYKNSSGYTALTQGIMFGSPEVVKLLLEKGADINTTVPNLVSDFLIETQRVPSGRTLIQFAEVYGRNDIVKVLKEFQKNKL